MENRITLPAQEAPRKTATESALRHLADFSTLLVWMTGKNGTCVYLNQNSAEGLATPGDLSFSVWSQFIHPDDLPSVKSVVLDAYAKRVEYQVEYRILKSDRTSRWMMGTGAPRFSDAGKFVGYFGTEIDISDRHQALEELARSEERFRSLTNLSVDWYWETDASGRFSFISEGMYSLWGGSPSEVVGKSRRDFVPNPAQSGFLKYLEKSANKEPFKDLRYAIKGRAEGDAAYISISGEPHFENGIFKGYRGVGRDVTQEMVAAERIAKLAEENKALIENSIDVMAVIDSEGRYLQVNNAVRDVLGFCPEEMIGMNYEEFLAPDDKAYARWCEANLSSSGDNTIRDLKQAWIGKDGRVVHMSSSGRWSDDRRVIYINARDISAQHSIHFELEAARNRISSILESIGDAFLAMDTEWRLTYVNWRAAKILGTDQGQLVGRIFWEAIPGVLDSPVLAHYRNAVETQENSFFETFYEPLESWFEVRAYPHKEGLSIFFHDISSRRFAEKEIRARDQRLRQVIEFMPAGYSMTNADGVLLEVNPAYCAITGYAAQELIGQNAASLLHIEPFTGSLYAPNGGIAVEDKEVSVTHKQGHRLCLLVSAVAERDEEGLTKSVTAFISDISQRKMAESRLEHLAMHDTLTELPNRALLHRHLQTILDCGFSQQHVAVMFIDLDRFKEVNDSMGHECGDTLLREVAGRLESHMRPGDIVARLGGDEFVITARCTNGRNSAAAIAERLLDSLAKPIAIGGAEVFVSASIGISLYPNDGATKDLLFQNADIAMYQAKASGRNKYCFYDSALSTEAKSRLSLETSLRRALERKEFELHYQPRIDLKSMRLIGMEALIRWNHPTLGAVSPSCFIPIAEERGYIDAIGEWVLQEACCQTQRLIRKLGHPLRVSVNLSARQLRLADLAQQVHNALSMAGLPANLLELELTETSLIDNLEDSVEMLTRLKTLGAKLAVDDFGVGYSGLNYLRRFPFDSLKLDQSFIRQQGNDQRHFQFIKACVDLAHALNLSVVAEGVETDDALSFLKEVGCDEGQGYLFAKPMPISSLEKLILNTLVTC